MGVPGEAWFALGSFDGFDTKPNCLGILAKLEGGSTTPTTTGYLFRIADSAYDRSTGSGGTYWDASGQLPLELKIPAKELKKYKEGESFQIVVFADGVTVQATYTATINMYYGVPMA